MEALESIQAYTALFDTAIACTAIYLTVISGYLIAIYAAGARLKRGQLLMVVFLFVVFEILFALGSYRFFVGAILVVSQSISDGIAFREYMPYVILSIQLLGIVAAMIFTWDIRKTANIKDT